jgi:hypothetical protein
LVVVLAVKDSRRKSAENTMTATAMETNLARQGSNFGLPIALHLAVLMKGGIGIVEVRVCAGLLLPSLLLLCGCAGVTHTPADTPS